MLTKDDNEPRFGGVVLPRTANWVQATADYRTAFKAQLPDPRRSVRQHGLMPHVRRGPIEGPAVGGLPVSRSKAPRRTDDSRADHN